jgi:DNA-binding NarL/FixJ family response regulator
VDFRIGLVDSNEMVRSGRSMVFNAQADMRVVFEESDPLLAIERAPEYLVDVLIVGPSQHRLRGGQFVSALSKALKEAKNDCAIISYNAFSDSRLRFEALRSGAQEFIGLDSEASSLITVVKRVVKKDFTAPMVELRVLSKQFGPLEAAARIEATLSELAEDQVKIVEFFLEGFRDQAIAKKLEVSHTRVSRLIDSLVEAADFTTRNQLAIFLLGNIQ